MLFQLVLVKLSAEQKTVKLLWVAYLSSLCFIIYSRPMPVKAGTEHLTSFLHELIGGTSLGFGS